MEKVFNKDLISIIVPIYNIEKELKECIDSLIEQTYKNIEIILVDDGSTDNCPMICDEYKKKDERIVVIHKKNGGLSDARNCGIYESKGEYLTFVDGDDMVTNNYCQFLYDTLKQNDADISIGKPKMIYADGIEVNKNYSDCFIGTNEEILDRLLYDNGIDLSACFKLYKKELFKDVSFPVNRLYEDAATTYKLIDKAKVIAVNTTEAIYIYKIRNNSISNCDFNEKKLDLIISTKEMTDFIKNKYPRLEKGCNRRLMYAYLSTLTQLARSKKRYKKIEKELISYIRHNKNDVLRDKKTPKRDKIGIYSLCFGFCGYKILWQIYARVSGRRI